MVLPNVLDLSAYQSKVVANQRHSSLKGVNVVCQGIDALCVKKVGWFV